MQAAPDTMEVLKIGYAFLGKGLEVVNGLGLSLAQWRPGLFQSPISSEIARSGTKFSFPMSCRPT